MATAGFQWGVPSASDAVRTYQLVQWRVGLADGEPTLKSTVKLDALFQFINRASIRVASDHTIDTVQGSDTTVEGAVTAIMNVAASFSLETMAKQYDAAFRKMVNALVTSRVKYEQGYFSGLFDHVGASTASGYVLLRSVAADDKDPVVIEGTRLPRGGKRVRLFSAMKETEGNIVVPQTDASTVETEFVVVGGSLSCGKTDDVESALRFVGKWAPGYIAIGERQSKLPALFRDDELDAMKPSDGNTVRLMSNLQKLQAVLADVPARIDAYRYSLDILIGEIRDTEGGGGAEDPDPEGQQMLRSMKQNPVLFFHRDGREVMPTLTPENYEAHSVLYQGNLAIGYSNFESIRPEPVTTPLEKTPAVVLSPAYRALQAQEQNVRRFRVHMMQSAGFNPALWGSEENVGQFDVAESSAIDFDAVMKAFEYDMRAHDSSGYTDIFERILTTVLGVVFTTTPRPKLSDLGTFYPVSLLDVDLTESFFFVPATDVITDPKCRERFMLPTCDSNAVEFMKTYPTWCGGGDGTDPPALSSASLFLWRHAVSRITRPHDPTAYMTTVNDVAAMIAQLTAFQPFDKKEAKTCRFVQEEVMRRLRPKFKTMTHAIQITGPRASITDRHWPQAFPPLAIDMPGARFDGDRFRYNIGGKSTELLESVMIAYGLLQQLLHGKEKDDTEPEARSPAKGTLEDDMIDVALSDVPRPTFEPMRIDTAFQKDRFVKMTGSRHPELPQMIGLTNTYSCTGSSSIWAVDDDYLRFLGLDSKCHNKSGRYVVAQTTAAPGEKRRFATFPTGCVSNSISSRVLFGSGKNNFYFELKPGLSSGTGTYDECVYKALTEQVVTNKRLSLPVRNTAAELVGFVTMTVDIKQKYGSSTKVTCHDEGTSLYFYRPDMMQRIEKNDWTFSDVLFVYLKLGETSAEIGQLQGTHTISKDVISAGLEAYGTFWPPVSSVSHKKLEEGKQIKLKTIVDKLVEGCQGFEYSNAKALNRTVFAAFLNKTDEKVRQWYSTVNEYGEPRAISMTNPGPENKNEAVLFHCILSREGAVRVPSAHAPPEILTRVVVLVRGSGRDSLQTPCEIDAVARTPEYYKLQADLFGRIQSRISMMRKLPTGAKHNCLAVLLRQRPDCNTIRKIVGIDARFAPVIANALLRIRDYNEVTRHTDKARNRQALETAVTEIGDTVFTLLYLT